MRSEVDPAPGRLSHTKPGAVRRVVSYAAAGIAPPCSVKLIGTLPTLVCPRADTHWALNQIVAPLATVFGKRISAVERVTRPSKWYAAGSSGASGDTAENKF